VQKKLQKLLEQAYELCEDGNYVRALEYYDMALDIEPDNLNAMVDNGVTLQNLGRFNEALQMYEKALSIEAENLDALINKGSVLHILKKYSEAISCMMLYLIMIREIQWFLRTKALLLERWATYHQLSNISKRPYVWIKTMIWHKSASLLQKTF